MTTSSDRSVPCLAAVIVARDEEPFIGRCIESVLAAGAPYGGFEVVVVDSRSTDRTAEIARDHDVTTVRIREGVRCTAALARNVGQRLTRSRHVLFADGDTVIDGEWVRRAVALLDADPGVAGVAGKLCEIYYRGGVRVGETADFFRMGPNAEEAYQLGGNAIYRRAALDEVGSFHGGVISHEEAELAGRLRRSGARLVRIPLTVGVHHTGARDGWEECWRRFRSGLMVGYGQVLRLSLGTTLFWSHARALSRFMITLAFLALGVVLLVVAALSGRVEFALAWLALGASVAVLFMIRARSIRRPVSVLAEWTLAAPCIVWGFARGALPTPSSPEVLAQVLHTRAGQVRELKTRSC